MERVIKNVIIGINDSALLDFTTNDFLNKAIEPKFPRLTYQTCIEELKENGECVTYGDDLSDSSCRLPGHDGADRAPRRAPRADHQRDDEGRLPGHEVDLARPWRRVKLVDALEEHGLWTRDPDDLRARLEERGIDTKADRSWAQLVDHALTSFVEPALIEPSILHDYPVELSPFARATDDDPSIVERFEFFVGGTELGNAFSELNDPDEQAERFAQQASEVGGEQGDPDYVEALAYGMPPTGGLGVGIDRLTMVLTGRDTIRDVILFPALRERGG